jgi:phosphatidylserine/phosphatidylglycerophosphate/cardiolipin synthase-like enzyme
VKVPNPIVTRDGVRVENYFSPTDDVMAKLLAYVLNAEKSVHFMIFTFTSDDLSTALIAQFRTGLDVQGVIEGRGANQGALSPLYCAGLPVRVDGNRYTMHHKVLIIDGKTVITGSFNFTRAADTINDDNVIIIHSPVAAAMYEQEFQRIMSAARTPQTADITCPRE